MYHISLFHGQLVCVIFHFRRILDNSADSVCRKLRFLLNLGLRASFVIASRTKNKHTAYRGSYHSKYRNRTDHFNKR